MIKPLTYQLSTQYTHRTNKSKSCIVTKCGNWHMKQQVCPALGAECRKCGQRIHFAEVCRTKTTQPLYNYTIQKETPHDDNLFIGILKRAHQAKDWTVTILLSQQRTIFKIDTGTQCNVIPQWKYYQMCHSNHLQLT